jgi:pilin isopeptide linkage protein/uncharacterized repeat protein (TIGR01451 family)
VISKNKRSLARVLAMVMILCFVLSTVSVSAFAADSTTGNTTQTTLTDGQTENSSGASDNGTTTSVSPAADGSQQAAASQSAGTSVATQQNGDSQSAAAAETATPAATAADSSSQDAVLTAQSTPTDVSSYFHGTISTQDGGSEYVSGSTVTFLIKYKLDYGVINGGDYIYLTVPAALAVARLSVDPTHFSSALLDHTDADGNQVYKLVFTDTAKEGISGSMTLRVTAGNTGTSSITPTVTAGSDTLSITVIPGGSSETGTETRAIEKDALGSGGTGMSTGWNSKEGGYTIYDPDQGAVAPYRIYVNLKHAAMTNATVTDYLPTGLTFNDSISYVWTEKGQSDVDLTQEELSQITFKQDGNKLTWNLGNLLNNQKQLLIQYKATVPAGTAATYHNVAVINYTENGTAQIGSASRNIYPETNADASIGVKSVDKSEISDDPSDQYVEYSLTFKTHANDKYEMIPFEIGDIDLTDKLDANVTFDHVAYCDDNFSVTYDEATHSVLIKNTKRIADEGQEHEVSFVVNFKKVPVGTTVSNTVGGNTVKTKKTGGSMSLKAMKTLDGQQPGNQSYQFQLLDSNGKVLQTKVNATDGTVSFDPVSYSSKDSEKTFTYKVKEVQGNDQAINYDGSVYDVSVTPSQPDDNGKITATPTITKDKETATSMTFNNTTKKTSVNVTKTWIGTAAASATADLYADGVKTNQTLTLNADNSWKGAFSNLDQYKDGKTIAYTVQEEPLEGYTSAITGDAAQGYTITNTNTATLSIPVTKTWVGTAGTQATVHLLADGVQKDTATLTSDNQWKHTFDSLPKYDSTTGKEITYSVTEDTVAGYSSAITGDAAKGFTVTNTITGKTSVNVTKTWIGPAAASATADLYADGVKTDKTLALNADNSWKGAFSNLDQYKDGKTIAYTVQEEPLEGYTSAITGDAAQGYTITNTNTATLSIPVTKTWVGTVGTQATVHLLADGVQKDTATLTSDNQWKHTFDSLPKYDSTTGKEIAYTITEDAITGYTSAITGDATQGFTVTNTQTDTGIKTHGFSYTAVKSSNMTGQTVVSGDHIVYTITVTNTDKADLTGLWIRDYIPQYTHFVSADSDGQRGAINGKQHVDWFIPTLKVGESRNLTMTVEVDTCLPKGATIKNAALTQLTDSTTPPSINTPDVGTAIPTNEVDLTSADTTPNTGVDGGMFTDTVLAMIALGGTVLVVYAARRHRAK